MRDKHLRTGIWKNCILRVAVTVSLCGAVYAAWDHYQTPEFFDPGQYGDGSTLQGNTIRFPDQKQSGTGDGSEWWKKTDEAQEDRRPAGDSEDTRLLQMAQQETEPAREEQQEAGAEAAERAAETAGTAETVTPEQASAEVLAAAQERLAQLEDAAVPLGQLPDGTTSRTVLAGSGSSGNRGSGGRGSSGGSSSGGSSSGGSDGSGNGSGTPADPSEPENPAKPDDSNQLPPTDGGNGLPAKPGDQEQGIVPFPEEGIPEGDDGHVYSLCLEELEEGAWEQLYYSQPLQESDLLRAVYAYVEQDGVKKYRLDGYSDCFQVNDYPQVAEDDFGTTFAFRANPQAEWEETKWQYSVQPCKLVLEDWDGGELDCLFPGQGESVNLLKYNSELLPYEEGDVQDAIFPGWEQGQEALAGNFYTAREKGKATLTPAPMEAVPEGMTVELQSAQVDAELCYVQALTACDSYENSSDGTLDIPDGIQRVASEEEAGIRAMTMVVPEDVMEIVSDEGIAVDGAYEVDSRNPNYSSRDGVLFDREQTVLYQAPLQMESVEVPATVTEVCDYALANASKIRFLSEEPPSLRADTLQEGVKVYVPAGAADAYQEAWENESGDGADRIQIQEEEESHPGVWLGEDGVEYRQKKYGADGEVVLWKAPEDLEQFTPDSVPVDLTVVEIADRAFAGCEMLDLVVLPDTVKKIGEQVFAGSSLRELHISDSLRALNRDLLKGTSLELLDIEGEDLLELDYGKTGRAFTFGCEDFRILLNGEQPEEGELLTDAYLESWSLQILGYESRRELFWDILQDEFWHWIYPDWGQDYQTVWEKTYERILEGENQVRRLFGLDEADEALVDEEYLDELYLDEERMGTLDGEISDEDILDEDILDEDILDEDILDEDVLDEDILDEDIPDEDPEDEDIPVATPSSASRVSGKTGGRRA